ncbi:HlyD family secretion protein, partial [bacterium]|nr:HlyD family secretion protein [bacterium]
MNKRWIGLSIILIVAAVLVLLGWLKWEHGKIFPSTDNAYIGADVTAVSSRVPGTLLLVAAQENHSVQEG